MKKECPSCAMSIDKSSKECPVCGYEFPYQKARNIQWIAIILLALALMYFIL